MTPAKKKTTTKKKGPRKKKITTGPTPVHIKIEVPHSEQRLNTIGILAKTVSKLADALNNHPHITVEDCFIQGAPDVPAIEVAPNKGQGSVQHITVPFGEGTPTT